MEYQRSKSGYEKDIQAQTKGKDGQSGVSQQVQRGLETKKQSEEQQNEQNQKNTMKGRGFEEPLNQHSVNKAIINSQNMELSFCSHTHDFYADVKMQAKNKGSKGE